MPIYEHICGPCKVSVEGIFTHPYDPTTPPCCPVCRRQMVKKVSLPNFKLKGGGWASDGYNKGK